MSILRKVNGAEIVLLAKGIACVKAVSKGSHLKAMRTWKMGQVMFQEAHCECPGELGLGGGGQTEVVKWLPQWSGKKIAADARMVTWEICRWN